MPETAKSHEKEAAQMRRAELHQASRRIVYEIESRRTAIRSLCQELGETREQIRATNRLLEADDA